LIYSFSISVYSVCIRLASIWSNKAKAWTEGRKNWKENLQLVKNRAAGREITWVHCASLGEFEQGRPVIESLRSAYPKTFIVLSFFSPSGYEVRKDYNNADAVIYLPADTPANAKSFVEILNPRLVIFVKYEYWLNLLKSLEHHQVPVLMISSIFRSNQVFFKWYGNPWRNILNTIDYFFLQDDKSAALLQNLGLTRYTIAGDTRFDRVLDIAAQFTELTDVQKFCAGSDTLVAGSTWKEDEELISEYLQTRKDLKCILAPHEIHESHLQQIEKLIPDAIRFSKWKQGSDSRSRVLIIDNIGMLSRLYHYSTISYIGGGFGKGIHNTLEAAVHGKPVIFGPTYHKFKEAVELIESGGAFSIQDSDSFVAQMNELLDNSKACSEAGHSARSYVRENAGATKKIMTHIQENRLLTS
jgi:3-deoxy-D-manno-octulosonic-acid transferase